MYYKPPILQLLIEAKSTTKWTTINLKTTRILLFLNASLLHGLKEDDFIFFSNLSNIQKIVVVTMHI
jgi:hypothetical protein